MIRSTASRRKMMISGVAWVSWSVVRELVVVEEQEEAEVLERRVDPTARKERRAGILLRRVI